MDSSPDMLECPHCAGADAKLILDDLRRMYPDELYACIVCQDEGVLPSGFVVEYTLLDLESEWQTGEPGDSFLRIDRPPEWMRAVCALRRRHGMPI